MRNILISGASRGIGRCIAEKAIYDGHNISLGLRDIKSVKGSILDPKLNKNSKIIISKYDANNNKSAENWVANSVKQFGSIDTVIHCAGIFKRTKLNYSNGEEKDIENLWKTNLLGPWILTRAAWSYLSNVQNSRIIVLVSMSGKRSKGDLAAYTVSKFALMGLCHTIRNEGWDKGIRITAICPSWVNTDMSASVNTLSKENMTQPKDIVNTNIQDYNL